jgi:hypothetical protein
MQPTSLNRRPAPQLDAQGASRHTWAARKAGRNTILHDAGWATSPRSSRARQPAPARAWKRSPWRLPRRTVPAVGHGSRRAPVGIHGCTHCGLILDRGEHAASTRRALGNGAGRAVGASRGCPRGRTETRPRWSACGVSDGCLRRLRDHAEDLAPVRMPMRMNDRVALVESARRVAVGDTPHEEPPGDQRCLPVLLTLPYVRWDRDFVCSKPHR